MSVDLTSLEADMTAWRRHIHRHPELGFHELGTGMGTHLLAQRQSQAKGGALPTPMLIEHVILPLRQEVRPDVR